MCIIKKYPGVTYLCLRYFQIARIPITRKAINKTRNTITDANTITRVLSDAVEFVGGGEGEGRGMSVLSCRTLLAKLGAVERNSVTVSMSRGSESGVEERGGGGGEEGEGGDTHLAVTAITNHIICYWLGSIGFTLEDISPNILQRVVLSSRTE